MENAEFVDAPAAEIVYQPYVYGLARFLAERGGFGHIIDIGAGNGEKLAGLPAAVQVTAVDFAPNLPALRQTLPNATVIDHNLETGLPALDPAVVADAVVISADVIEHLREPHHYLQGLARLAAQAPFVLVSTPDRTRARGPEDYGPPANPAHVREWTIDELYALFRRYGLACRIGHTTSDTLSHAKATSLALGGTQALMPGTVATTTSALAVMTAYNERDIIERSIEHLLVQGLDVHVVENWSTDGTYEIVQRLAQAYPGVSCERFPEVQPKTSTYEWQALLQRVQQIAASTEHEWVLHNDADEFRQSPWKGVTLRDALSFVGTLGYNAVDFTVLEFRATRDGYDGTVAPDQFFGDFDFGDFSSYLVQVKGWRTTRPVTLTESGGHEAAFESRRIFPLKFTSRHYPLRSTHQARNKVFRDRLARFSEVERARGWHIQYDGLAADETFIRDAGPLLSYSPDFVETEYMVELLSGVGLDL